MTITTDARVLHRLDRIVQMNAAIRLHALLGDDAKALPFLLSCFTAPPRVTVAKMLCPTDTPHTTWFSRFCRLGLPSPKWYLKHARLLRLRAVADDYALSMAAVGDYMEWPSLSHLQVHVQRACGLSLTAFRQQTTTDGLLSTFMRDGITPHLETLRWFDPALSLTVNGRLRAAPVDTWTRALLPAFSPGTRP